MTQTQDKERQRAALALRIDALVTEGLSYSEIARKLSTQARPLTRSGVIGIHARLKQQRAEDARDLKILECIDAGGSAKFAAAYFQVSLAHIAGLIEGVNQ